MRKNLCPMCLRRKEDLLTKIASLYYLEKMSQKDIARKMGIPQSYVSRLMKEARRKKFVEIRIRGKKIE